MDAETRVEYPILDFGLRKEATLSQDNVPSQSGSLGLACFKSDLKRYLILMPERTFKNKIRLWVYTPGLWIILSYRIGRSLRHVCLTDSVLKPVLTVYDFLYFLLRLCVGIDIPLETQIGEGLYIGHFGGIIVHPSAIIGRNCNLSHGVTIGEGGRAEGRGVPTIGDRVYIGAGAKIFGAITVGNDVAIGANAVVSMSVPDGAVVGGIPARILSNAGSHEFVVVERGNE